MKQFSVKKIFNCSRYYIRVRIPTACVPTDSFEKVRESCQKERSFLVSNFKKSFNGANARLHYDESKVVLCANVNNINLPSSNDSVVYEIMFRVSLVSEKLVDSFISNIS